MVRTDAKVLSLLLHFAPARLSKVGEAIADLAHHWPRYYALLNEVGQRQR